MLVHAINMEGKKVDDTWKNFWQSGKVTDYLSYRNSYADSYIDRTKDSKEKSADVTNSRTDRDGFKRHAHWGI